MPLRVGIDLVHAGAVRDALATHGDRYLARVFTPAEAADCTGPDGPDPLALAARVAAKEAAMKVFRVGDRALPWTAIEVRREASGAPELTLHGLAAELAAEVGIGDLALSLTHEDEYAAAVVVAQLDVPGQEPPL